MWWDDAVEASTYDAFYKCLTASFRDHTDPTASYERDYRPLEQKIERVLATHGVPENKLWMFDDWCRNCSRHVTVEERYVTPAIVIELHGLLVERYAGWRIELILERDIDADDVTGMIALQQDWVLCFGNGRALIDAIRRSRT